jgi:alginate O-acetyltransferase complex protein AlgJ
MEACNKSGSNRARNNRLRQRVQNLLFALALTLPAAGYWLDINDYSLLAENRRLAELPVWPSAGDELRAFPRAFERYFDDHFGFRSYLVGREKRLEWLGPRTKVEIQIGQNEWLFQGTRKSIASLSCVEPSEAILDAWLDLNRARTDRLEAQGVGYHWIVAPNKHTVHPEYLPPHIVGHSSSCEARRIATAFSDAGLPFLDLRPILFDQKGEQTLYHQTDTHWNQLGAAYAVSEITQRLRVEFPNTPTFEWSDYEVFIEDEPFEGNLAARLRVYSESYSEPFLRLARQTRAMAEISSTAAPIDLRRHSREDLIVDFSSGQIDSPTAIVFHDSFGFAAMEMLAEHFESVRFVNFHGLIDYAMVEELRPDVVLSLVVESRLLHAPIPDEGLSLHHKSTAASVASRLK